MDFEELPIAVEPSAGPNHNLQEHIEAVTAFASAANLVNNLVRQPATLHEIQIP